MSTQSSEKYNPNHSIKVSTGNRNRYTKDLFEPCQLCQQKNFYHDHVGLGNSNAKVIEKFGNQIKTIQNQQYSKEIKFEEFIIKKLQEKGIGSENDFQFNMVSEIITKQLAQERRIYLKGKKVNIDKIQQVFEFRFRNILNPKKQDNISIQMLRLYNYQKMGLIQKIQEPQIDLGSQIYQLLLNSALIKYDAQLRESSNKIKAKMGISMQTNFLFELFSFMTVEFLYNKASKLNKKIRQTLQIENDILSPNRIVKFAFNNQKWKYDYYDLKQILLVSSQVNIEISELSDSDHFALEILLEKCSKYGKTVQFIPIQNNLNFKILQDEKIKAYLKNIKIVHKLEFIADYENIQQSLEKQFIEQNIIELQNHGQYHKISQIYKVLSQQIGNQSSFYHSMWDNNPQATFQTLGDLAENLVFDFENLVLNLTIFSQVSDKGEFKLLDQIQNIEALVNLKGVVSFSNLIKKFTKMKNIKVSMIIQENKQSGFLDFQDHLCLESVNLELIDLHSPSRFLLDSLPLRLPKTPLNHLSINACSMDLNLLDILFGITTEWPILELHLFINQLNFTSKVQFDKDPKTPKQLLMEQVIKDEKLCFKVTEAKIYYMVLTEYTKQTLFEKYTNPGKNKIFLHFEKLNHTQQII